MDLLEIKNLKVSYGPIEAIKGVDIAVERGKITAILGANGAGKTTVLRAVSGLVKASGGEVAFNGKKINGMSANRIARLGLTQSPEGRLIFYGLTAEENLRAGGFSLKKIKTDSGSISAKAQYEENLKKVYDLFPVLKERRSQAAHTLSGGEQQMLAIGRALMAGPKLLLLDEPSLGLAPLVIKDIFAKLKEIRDAGTTILIVEQNAYATLKLADYGYVLELGRVSMRGVAEELLGDEKLIAAYLGGKNKNAGKGGEKNDVTGGNTNETEK